VSEVKFNYAHWKYDNSPTLIVTIGVCPECADPKEARLSNAYNVPQVKTHYNCVNNSSKRWVTISDKQWVEFCIAANYNDYLVFKEETKLSVAFTRKELSITKTDDPDYTYRIIGG